MRWLAFSRDLARDISLAIVLNLKRTLFVVGGGAVGLAIFVALTALGSAGGAAVSISLASADGVLVTARPAGGAIDNGILEQWDASDSVPTAESAEKLSVGSSVVVSDALSSSAGTSHEAVLVLASGDFSGTSRAWPQLPNEVVLSQSLAARLGMAGAASPYVVRVAGILQTVVDTVAIPDSLGLSADAVIVSPGSNLPSDAKEATTYRVVVTAERGQSESVARALPLLLSPAQPERVSVLTTLPSDRLQSAIGQQTSLWLNSAAALGLLVAAAGISLPLVMAISERRPEIGLRRAIGFPTSSIVLQFTTEGLFAATAGGVLGAGLGSAVQAAMCVIFTWPVRVDLGLAIAGIAIASGLGVLAGAASAMMAMRVSPLEALKPGI